MVLTPELAEKIQDIYRGKLELEFRDPLIAGPISVEPTQNSEGEAGRPYSWSHSLRRSG